MSSSKKQSGEEDVAMSAASDVPGFFKGRCVFVTGGTGFMGKVLVEKLLRSCPDIDTIYLLMRPKRGNDVRTRHEEFIRGQVFDRLRNERPGFASQLIAIGGDVTLENLGLTPEDRSLIQKRVSVVFHSAANVRFDGKLKTMIRCNTMGIKRVLELAEGIENLDAFVHVSTSYCHCDQPVLEEVTYPSPTDPRNILQLVEWMDDDVLECITPKLVGKQPNTYAYSKNLSEQLVTDYSSKIPTAIARPSVVTATWREPVPGWLENLNGPTGFIVSGGKGIVHSAYTFPDASAEIMPCDIAINAIIILAWRVANLRPTQPLVCNVTESGDNPLCWGYFVDRTRECLRENPFSDAMWYPDASLTTSRLVYTFFLVFLHYLPAYFIDFIVKLFGKKPFMVTTQRRIQGGFKVLEYYTTKHWVFRNNNLKALSQSLTEEDRETFCTDIKMTDWDIYIKNYVLGTRHYLLKEDPATLPAARRRMRKLYWLYQIVRVLFCLLILWMLISWYNYIIACFQLTINTILQMFRIIPTILAIP